MCDMHKVVAIFWGDEKELQRSFSPAFFYFFSGSPAKSPTFLRRPGGAFEKQEGWEEAETLVHLPPPSMQIPRQENV